MELYERAAALLKSGTALVRITALPICEELSRLKSEIKNDEAPKLSAFRESMNASLDALRK
jgi:V/A-type H+-transporting ATPase subunit A